MRSPTVRPPRLQRIPLSSFLRSSYVFVLFALPQAFKWMKNIIALDLRPCDRFFLVEFNLNWRSSPSLDEFRAFLRLDIVDIRRLELLGVEKEP